MTLTKLTRNGQVTLPAEARRKLRLAEGDYLEAEVVGTSVVLTPKVVVDREAAWQQVREAQAAVRYTGPAPRPSPEEEEQQVYDIVGEFRDRHG